MLIDALIGELLLRNNCVVIANFGGFIASRVPASVDFATGKIQAPKKAILFNKQLTNSDGLLLAAYAVKNGCSYEEAGEKIDSLVKNWFEELHTGKRISFEKVGYLYLDNEKNIRFEQDRFFNLLLQSFGMSQVQFVSEKSIETHEAAIIQPVFTPKEEQKHVADGVPVAEIPVITLIPEIRIKKEEKSAEPEEIRIVPVVKIPASRRKLSRYVAAACLLPIAFYSVWIPMKTDVLESGMFSLQDFNPFHQQPEGTYTRQALTKFPVIPQRKSFEAMVAELPSEVSVFPLEFENEGPGEENELFYIRLKEEQAKASEVLPEIREEKAISRPVEKKSTERIEMSTATGGRFKIVAGSFSNQNNALSLANELKTKGFSAFTMEDSKGLVRVIAGASDSEQQANEIVNRLRQNSIASWILK